MSDKDEMKAKLRQALGKTREQLAALGKTREAVKIDPSLSLFLYSTALMRASLAGRSDTFIERMRLATEAAKAGVEQARRPTDDPAIVERAKERAADLAALQVFLMEEYGSYFNGTADGDSAAAESAQNADAGMRRLAGFLAGLVGAAAAAERMAKKVAGQLDVSGEGDPAASHHEVGAGLLQDRTRTDTAPGDALGLHGGLRTLMKDPEEC